MALNPGPFNPGDPFDLHADTFRRHMVHIFDVTRATQPAFAELTEERQLQCFLCGVLTGALGVAIAHVTPESRDEVVQMLVEYLPQARLNVEDILREGMH